ncbi:3'-5' exonuclease [Pectobacterium versatile]|uniref:3'-5' exonuclease n=1 Tax=Pectobacterium versatile TaxID=2488639 RepID=UPI001CCFA836|nr:3'-5' exonuclease [Pectobacterium versatile]
MNIYIDLETIPAQNPEIKDEIAANIKAPAQYKKQESIDTWLAENRDAAAEEAWRKTSFDGGLGHIAVISAAIDDGLIRSFYVNDWQEPGAEDFILRDFFAFLHDNYDPSRRTPPVFIGHNIVEFDLRFLLQRAVVLNIVIPPFLPVAARPWDGSVYDTMTAWAGHRGTVSLDKLCRILNIPLKGSEIDEEIDGSKVWDFIQAGKISKVARYCEGDVERVRGIHKRMTFYRQERLEALKNA